jgi:hypothetical protein
MMSAQNLSRTAHAARPPVKACTCDFEPSDQHEGLCALQYDASAYLHGELQDTELAAFEALLSKNADCRRELNAIRRTEQALQQIGAEILLEPVPQFLLDVLSGPPRKTEYKAR